MVTIDALRPGSWQHDGSLRLRQSELYALTSALVVGPTALWLVDPGFLPGEVRALRQAVDRLLGRLRPRARYLLLTHADFDHILGVHSFPDFEVVASEAASPRLASCMTRARLIDGGLLLDRGEGTYRIFPIARPVAESTRLAGASLEPVSGHTRDGLVALLVGHDGKRLLVAGDYLSALEGPHISDWHGVAHTYATLARLLAEADWLMVGHGPPAQRPEARQRLAADVRYLAGLLGQRADQRPKPLVLTAEAPPGFSTADADRYHRDNVRLLFRTVDPVEARALSAALGEVLAEVEC